MNMLRRHVCGTGFVLPLLLSTLLTAQRGEPVEAAASRPDLTVEHPALMPNAITSFGACRVGGWLYVYGGHIGRAHAHTKDNVLGSFQRLNLVDGTTWQALPPGPPLQGTALVAAPDGSLYRVGGTDARNEKGDEADMHSTATVSRFDPDRGKWEAATPLPEPRSSHDAIVCGNKLYVVGGWNLQGPGDGDWHQTAWVADLSQQPLEWQPLPPLGHSRRACAVATFDGKIAVLGGIDEDRPINSARLLDPAAGEWTEIPHLPGFAFGTAALGIGEWLYATTMEGALLKWQQGADAWQPVAQFETPRFFHRMVEAPTEGRILAFGGAGRGGHMRTMETICVDGTASAALREFVIPTPGRVAYRQALVLQDNTIWAFGGNRRTGRERFAADQFATDVWKIELTTMTARHVGDLPEGVQSMAAVAWGGRRDNLLVGGLGVVGDRVDSRTQAMRWDMRRNKALPYDAGLPAPRTQHRIVRHADKVYVLGGVAFTPDADGGSIEGDTRDVLVFDPEADEPKFAASGIRLPRARRSFGATMLGSKLYLIGGLAGGFTHAGPCDVYDFETGEWSELEGSLGLGLAPSGDDRQSHLRGVRRHHEGAALHPGPVGAGVRARSGMDHRARAAAVPGAPRADARLAQPPAVLLGQRPAPRPHRAAHARARPERARGRSVVPPLMAQLDSEPSTAMSAAMPRTVAASTVCAASV